MTIQEKIGSYLEGLPSKWKEQLTTILCQIIADKEQPDCDKMRECETTTTLSPFTISGTTVSITYINEDSVQVIRSFDINEVLERSLNELDPSCLTDETTWSNLSYIEKIQLMIDAHCNCCQEISVIQYDSTDVEDCGEMESDILVNFIGQTGQGSYPFVLLPNIEYDAIIPVLSGSFKLFLYGVNQGNFIVIRGYDGDDNQLFIVSTDGTTGLSTIFNIEDLDHLLITCANSS